MSDRPLTSIDIQRLHQFVQAERSGGAWTIPDRTDFELVARGLLEMRDHERCSGFALFGCTARGLEAAYPMVWYWRKWPRSTWAGPVQLDERRGQRCRVLAVGARNAALVEFADGHQVLTSRYAARRAQ